MTVSVQMNVFSGRPDPVWSLSEAQFKELLGLEVIEYDATNGAHRGLGYRGFTIWPNGKDGLVRLRDKFGPNAIHYETGTFLPFQPVIEEFLLKTGSTMISNKILDAAMVNLSRLPVKAALPQGRCPANVATNPDYLPNVWNANSGITGNNNCYNYANDQLTSNRAIPGRANGAAVINRDCQSVSLACELDGLVQLKNRHFKKLTLRDPSKEWFVALAIDPAGLDYHFWRQDNDGCWSHKIGISPVTRLDNSSVPITDPQSCDPGPYIDFCQFLVSHRDNVIIS